MILKSLNLLFGLALLSISAFGGQKDVSEPVNVAKARKLEISSVFVGPKTGSII